MMWLLEILAGVPLTRKSRDVILQTMVTGRTQVETHEFLSWSVSQNTEKSGALLAAQAIFLGVNSFALGRGWPRPLTIGSLILLLAATLLLMSNLRTSWWSRHAASSDWRDAQQQIFDRVMSRSLRFNIALYLTFLSIILLGIAALSVS